jgi:hypothetical protein
VHKDVGASYELTLCLAEYRSGQLNLVAQPKPADERLQDSASTTIVRSGNEKVWKMLVLSSGSAVSFDEQVESLLLNSQPAEKKKIRRSFGDIRGRESDIDTIWYEL